MLLTWLLKAGEMMLINALVRHGIARNMRKLRLYLTGLQKTTRISILSWLISSLSMHGRPWVYTMLLLQPIISVFEPPIWWTG